MKFQNGIEILSYEPQVSSEDRLWIEIRSVNAICYLSDSIVYECMRNKSTNEIKSELVLIDIKSNKLNIDMIASFRDISIPAIIIYEQHETCLYQLLRNLDCEKAVFYKDSDQSLWLHKRYLMLLDSKVSKITSRSPSDNLGKTSKQKSRKIFAAEISGTEEYKKAKEKIINKVMSLAVYEGFKDIFESVLSELCLNAIFHAPFDSSKNSFIFSEINRSQEVSLPNGKIIRLEINLITESSVHFLELAVRDPYGSLKWDRIWTDLARGATIEKISKNCINQSNISLQGQFKQNDSGSGVGLITSIKLSNLLEITLCPGKFTDVKVVFLLSKRRIEAERMGNNMIFLQLSEG